MDEAGFAQDSRAVREVRICRQQQPGDGGVVHDDLLRRQFPHDLAATVALPRRAISSSEMADHDVAVSIEQCRTRHGVPPVATIPGVDLNADGVAVEVYLVAVVD